MDLTYNRYLVTGGAGFIGSHLVDKLLQAGKEVITLDDFNHFYPARLKEDNIKAHLSYDNFNLVRGDIRDKELVDEVIDTYAPEVIIHLAARAGVRPSLNKPYLYQSTNIEGTLNLLEGARKYKIDKFIFGSSSSVYGKNKKVPFSEDDALLNPASPYAATKISGETLCQTYADLYEIPTVSLRFFTVFGPRQRPDLAIRKFTERILNDEKITLFGDGYSARDYTYVDDIVDGILKAVNYEIVEQKSEHLFENFNLGNSTPVKLIELVRSIEKVLGKEANIEWAPDQPGDVPITYADISRSKEKLGYSPSTSLEEGLKVFAEWITL
ncbi:GDP-mannose 4,6-dehydratase [Natranaerofaba carboxydovora]|uniref:GDP-mannose 4,6-dehydratase n=1 Tax=Natranaerofaba carboxydovora TaxID=2742683 RepID=UPI001F12C4FA|nr:GDP-mannose 4,6-dehydratase [Natranaerofaba carboxydovora]UMZ74735.1 UDP-glucose 4-epimerase [Natranaerofaba carboxydovora]